MTAIQALLIPVGDNMYALDATAVREVVTEPLPTRVPTAPPWILGVFNLRGEVVPLFDTAAIIGVGRMTSVTFVVVVTTSVGLAGLVVSGLPQVARLDDHVGPSDMRCTLGMYAFNNDVAVLLDVEALLVTSSRGTDEDSSRELAHS